MRRTHRNASTVLFAAVVAFGWLATPASGQVATAVERASPESVGLSSEALEAIGPAMKQLIDGGRTGAIMTLVSRRGKVVHWEAEGWRVLDEDPLEPNDVFRIYSMTKPVTSTAIMMLVEEGRIALTDPVSRFIPAFSDVRVYGEDGEMRSPSEPVTIWHLLTHTSGLTYGVFSNTPVDVMYREQLDALSMNTDRDLESTVDVLAGLPLIGDPGARWNYSMSTDVLGRVVEVASGMSLADFFESRIFRPLGMDDTGFHVEPQNLSRFTAVYERGEGGLRLADSPVDGPFTRSPGWYSGGGGLTSTAADYLRFAQMMLNEGELDGVRLLKTETVREMTRNHLPDDLVPIGPLWPGQGFGLGFAVSVEENAGTYWWAGVANTYFWVDPEEELIAFAWTQFNPFGGAAIDRVLRPIVYGAITDGN